MLALCGGGICVTAQDWASFSNERMFSSIRQTLTEEGPSMRPYTKAIELSSKEIVMADREAADGKS